MVQGSKGNHLNGDFFEKVLGLTPRPPLPWRGGEL